MLHVKQGQLRGNFLVEVITSEVKKGNQRVTVQYGALPYAFPTCFEQGILFSVNTKACCEANTCSCARIASRTLGRQRADQMWVRKECN